MKIIEYKKLYDYLRNEDSLQSLETLKVIYKIRQLPKEYRLAILNIIEGNIPTLSDVEGISYSELVEKDGMRPIRAVLMLDWIRREPDDAIRYMAEETFRAPLQPLSEEEFDAVTAAIERLKQDVPPEDIPQEPVVDNSEDDIEVD